jgi:DNA polymerase-2
MKEVRGFIVYADYLNQDEKTLVRLFGKLEDGKSFCSIHNITPYFYIKEKDKKHIPKDVKKEQIEETKFTNFAKEPVIKITVENQTELNKISSELHKAEIDTFEADIKPVQRFLMDNNILNSLTLEGESEPSERIDKVYKNPKISPTDFVPDLKVISIDIETDKSSDKLFCIGIYSKNYHKNFLVGDKRLDHTISCKTEAECLDKFKSELLKLDPDIITGWNLIDFDLKILQSLFAKNKISFDLGRTNEQTKLRIESSFFRNSSADMPGRQVLDAMGLIQDPFIQEAPSIRKAEFENYTLEAVSQAILGKGKLIKGKDRHEEIEELYTSKKEEDLQKLVDYNLMDCQLVYDILERTDMMNLVVERSMLTGLQFDKLGASIAAFDSLYIRECKKHHLVSPTTRFGNKEERIKGGYVYSSKPGIYHNVLIFDFKSLYPSIVKTFNIDPASFLDKTKGKEKNVIEAPNKVYFRNTNGILPEIIERLHEAREKAKKEHRELSSYAIKIIMNSFFGVLASPNCRYFNLDMANGITYFGQMLLKLTETKIAEMGYKVIYEDTDSCFVESNLAKTKANELALKIQSYINDFYNKYVRENYHRTSFLELQFQKQYLSMMIPAIRVKKTAKKIAKEKAESKTGEELEAKAAKKRYAGLIEKNGKEELEITGLEAIRGDWTDAAQEFQKELLMKIFHKEEIFSFIKSYIKKIKQGKLDSQLVYRKSIRKNLDEYVKTTPPHVKAARLLDHLDSNIIEYYITEAGPEPIQKLKHKLDYDHYIEKQIKPIANQILAIFDKDFDDLIKDNKQAKLF